MLDRSKIGYEFNRFNTDVEKGRLRFFAKAIGETNPIYTEEAAARDAGYKAIPAPPTFAFSLGLDGPELLPVLDLLNMEMGRILHGTQEFQYLGQVYAGDTITVYSKIKDIFDKKGGALEFVVMESTYTNQDDEIVVKSEQTLVYRH